MAKNDVQESILEAIQILFNEKIKKTQYTSSSIGRVLSMSDDYKSCTVDLQGNQVTCTLLEHLMDWIQPNDIVMIQDIYNNNAKRIVIGKVGGTQETNFLIFDDETNRTVSGVDQIYDENTEKVIHEELKLE